jgi:hypothetical protein
MLTSKQHELLLFINRRLNDSGVSPSFDEMREALDLKSKSGVHRLISALEERGFIRRLPNRARALEVLKLPESAAPSAPAPRPVIPAAANDTIEIPMHGRIAAVHRAGSRPAHRSRRCRAPKASPSRPRFSVPASITRSRCPAIRWSTKAFSTATSR